MKKTRNANGEGSICKVSENKWVGRITMGLKSDGKVISKQFSGKTEAIVKKKIKDYKNSREYFEKKLPCSDTAEAYFNSWLNDYQKNRLKPVSYDRLESVINNHIIPRLGKIKLDKLTGDDIQELINHLYNDEGYSYSSVKKVYNALNACCKHALYSGVVNRNPCVSVVLPAQSERTKSVVSMTEDEVHKLKSAIEDAYKANTLVKYGYAYLLILNTGLRMGEALSLRWDDIDFEKKTITVSKNTIMAKKRDENGKAIGGYELKLQNSTKTFSGNRVIPMNKSAEESLMKLKEENHTPYVIVNGNQKQVLPSNFERAFHNILKNVGLPEYGVHALRHTFASLLFDKGIDVKIVSKLLGHSTVRITYDTYVHVFDKNMAHVTNVLD